ncbi:hypothetical protein ANCCEY_04370 [Ancylostoma ceylanicum]|uniref:Uncharacterized protein n=1 Tax=Ancylostoma ceylanicum TaxID=53326 RepID=A0A0D6LXG9_9BILA|nr:hypothetical protein ANCCEY_04370 [Ancylostoma ceylanicum]
MHNASFGHYLRESKAVVPEDVLQRATHRARFIADELLSEMSARRSAAGEHIPRLLGRMRCVLPHSDDSTLDGQLRLLRLQPPLPLPVSAIENPPRRVRQLDIGGLHLVGIATEPLHSRELHCKKNM